MTQNMQMKNFSIHTTSRREFLKTLGGAAIVAPFATKCTSAPAPATILSTDSEMTHVETSLDESRKGASDILPFSATGNMPLVLEITRFSPHDGPGIRTTVYLKGCHMRCSWCHNPESISSNPQIGFHKNRCILCKSCAEVCPVGAHTFSENKHEFNHAICTTCGKCVEACLSGVLVLYGRELPPETISEAVLEDLSFYQNSNGGCTISGGEPLLYPEFCAEIFRLLKQHNVHCAIDTSGEVIWEAFEKVLPYTDLFLYDLKHVDSDLHSAHTGRGNKKILENLQHLSRLKIPTEMRIPVIPKFNANNSFMRATGRFLSQLKNITAVRLLPFHASQSKYETIGAPYLMDGILSPTADQMASFAAILQSYHLTVINT